MDPTHTHLKSVKCLLASLVTGHCKLVLVEFLLKALTHNGVHVELEEALQKKGIGDILDGGPRGQEHS